MKIFQQLVNAGIIDTRDASKIVSSLLVLGVVVLILLSVSALASVLTLSHTKNLVDVIDQIATE